MFRDTLSFPLQLARRRREMSEAISRIPELADIKPLPFLDRFEKVTEGSRKLAVIKEHVKELIDEDNYEEGLHLYQFVIL